MQSICGLWGYYHIFIAGVTPFMRILPFSVCQKPNYNSEVYMIEHMFGCLEYVWHIKMLIQVDFELDYF